FHGMPRSTAEYIQSYSRVGRSVPGTVYLSFNPMQVRDRSHYHQFHHYHEYEDLLVEATPLERWAKYAIEQTISGVLCAALLQYYDFTLAEEISGRLYDLKGLQEAFHEDLLTKQDIEGFLLDAYDVVDTDDDATDAAAIYADRIDALFDTIWQFLLAEEDSGNTFIPSVLERGQEDDSLPGVRRPMTNLRDIDEQIPIEPDTETAKSVHLFNQ
ncbi:helicase, partial [Halorubrum sp. Atlit-28R]